MHVAVGSLNPVKRAATERVVPEWSVEPVAVDSGVAEQPTGHDETVRGAQTRARNAFAAIESADFGVGIEGGVATFDGSALTDDGGSRRVAALSDPSLVMWAAVTDGDRMTWAAGPALPLPDAVAARIDDGEELGPVLDDVLGTVEIAKQGGAAAAFTADAIDRESALAHAVAGAFGPYVSDLY